MGSHHTSNTFAAMDDADQIETNTQCCYEMNLKKRRKRRRQSSESHMGISLSLSLSPRSLSPNTFRELLYSISAAFCVRFYAFIFETLKSFRCSSKREEREWENAFGENGSVLISHKIVHTKQSDPIRPVGQMPPNFATQKLLNFVFFFFLSSLFGGCCTKHVNAASIECTNCVWKERDSDALNRIEFCQTCISNMMNCINIKHKNSSEK